MPPKSPKYTAPSTTAGVAETSPVVAATHLVASRATFSGPIECSDGWLRLFAESLPIIPQSGPPPTVARIRVAPTSAPSNNTKAATRNKKLVKLIGGFMRGILPQPGQEHNKTVTAGIGG